MRSPSRDAAGDFVGIVASGNPLHANNDTLQLSPHALMLAARIHESQLDG
jgi:hypothetical protein